MFWGKETDWLTVIGVDEQFSRTMIRFCNYDKISSKNSLSTMVKSSVLTTSVFFTVSGLINHNDVFFM